MLAMGARSYNVHTVTLIYQSGEVSHREREVSKGKEILPVIWLRVSLVTQVEGEV